MNRMLVIPAAGRGTRLGWEGPKVLCPVAGRPMIDYLFSRYASLVDRVVVVVAPAARAEIQRHIDTVGQHAELVVQVEPTGMLPAILCARRAVEAHRPDYVWITWCDQIAISADTVRRLAGEIDRYPDAPMVFPTVRQEPPYIHFARDSHGRIIRVLQRREGDDMPPVGESDTGLFALRRDAYLDDLAEYDGLAPEGDGTRERNFLPFIPWLAGWADVRTFDVADSREAVGVNTPDDIGALERYLRERR